MLTLLFVLLFFVGLAFASNSSFDTLDASALIQSSRSSFAPLTDAVRSLLDTSLLFLQRKKQFFPLSEQHEFRQTLIAQFGEAAASLGGLEYVKTHLEALGFFFVAPLSLHSGKRGVPLGEWLQCPNVFSVAAFDNFWAVPILSVFEVQNKSFLEIGSGIGYASIIAAKFGAKKVTAIDVSAAAVHCTKANAVLHDVPHLVEAIQSDLFASLQGRTFDLIYWNIPWSAEAGGTGSAVMDEMTGTRPLLFRLLKDVRNHLTEGGSLLLVICLDVSRSPDACMSEGEFRAVCAAHGFPNPTYVYEDDFEESNGEVIVMARLDNINKMAE